MEQISHNLANACFQEEGLGQRKNLTTKQFRLQHRALKTGAFNCLVIAKAPKRWYMSFSRPKGTGVMQQVGMYLMQGRHTAVRAQGLASTSGSNPKFQPEEEKMKYARCRH